MAGRQCYVLLFPHLTFVIIKSKVSTNLYDKQKVTLLTNPQILNRVLMNKM